MYIKPHKIDPSRVANHSNKYYKYQKIYNARVNINYGS